MRRNRSFTRKLLTVTIGAMLLIFSLAGAAFTQATTTTTNEFVPLAQANFVPCANGGAGEVVLLTGTLHILTHLTVNNNRANIKQQFQPQGVSGVGQTTGDTYRGVGGTKFHDTIPLTGGAASFSTVNNFRLIGPGPDNNLQIHSNVHTTINANGDVTSEVDNTSIECN